MIDIYLCITIIISCIITVNGDITSWITLPNHIESASLGQGIIVGLNYQTNIGYIFGGDTSTNKVYSYNFSNNNFDELNGITLPINNIHSIGQGYYQQNQYIYIWYDYQINRYDIITHTMQLQYTSTIFDPNDVPNGACLTINEDTNYLYVGSLRTFVFNGTQWNEFANPSQRIRTYHSCNIHKNILFYIAGFYVFGNSRIFHRTLEYIPVTDVMDVNNSWTQGPNLFDISFAWHRSILYDNIIYIIGGYGGTGSIGFRSRNRVYLFDPETYSIELQILRLDYNVDSYGYLFNPNNNRFYLFGGFPPSISNNIMYSNIIANITKMNITFQPTTERPTFNPSVSTSTPTLRPTPEHLIECIQFDNGTDNFFSTNGNRIINNGILCDGNCVEVLPNSQFAYVFSLDTNIGYDAYEITYDLKTEIVLQSQDDVLVAIYCNTTQFSSARQDYYPDTGLPLNYINADFGVSCSKNIDEPYYLIVLFQIDSNVASLFVDNLCLLANISTKAPTATTNIPTTMPSVSPTDTPTNSPTNKPTAIPTDFPTESTNDPTLTPSNAPTNSPTNIPSNVPTVSPSNNPTSIPSNTPTIDASNSPSIPPTNLPTNNPTTSTNASQIPTLLQNENSNPQKTGKGVTNSKKTLLLVLIPSTLTALCICISVVLFLFTYHLYKNKLNQSYVDSMKISVNSISLDKIKSNSLREDNPVILKVIQTEGNITNGASLPSQPKIDDNTNDGHDDASDSEQQIENSNEGDNDTTK